MSKNTISILALSTALSACEKADPPKEEPSEKEAEVLEDFQESGEEAKKAYKIEVKRSRIGWDTDDENEDEDEKK